MSLKYTCPGCGTPLSYEGLCWKYECEKSRKATLGWTPEQIAEKQKNLTQNVQQLADMENPEFTDFQWLLGYQDAVTPGAQRAALAIEGFYPCELYYGAPDDVRDTLIITLLETDNSQNVAELMPCLAFQGDDKAIETLLEPGRNPRPWCKSLYADLPSYAQCGGWTSGEGGHRARLNLNTCYPVAKETTDEASPVHVGWAREDTCPHCGGCTMDMLVLDGRDERLRFLGLDGILTATRYPNYVGFLKSLAFNRFILDGGVETPPPELFGGAEGIKHYVRSEDYKTLTENSFVLVKAPMPLFYGAACDGVNTTGDFTNWVQDVEYTICSHCRKPVKCSTQIRWDTAYSCAEGTLYVELCPDCQVLPIQRQQT